MHMFQRWLPLVSLAVLTAVSACRNSRSLSIAAVESPESESIWEVDLIRTLPGAQADYIRSIKANWTNGRNLARARGAVLSYRALVAPVDSARGWDVLLITEYADSAAYARREATFDSIFKSPEFVRVEPPRPNDALRVFTAIVPMRSFVGQPR